MSTSTMTLSPQPISIHPVSMPTSDVDFGTVIENVDLENLTGKSISRDPCSSRG